MGWSELTAAPEVDSIFKSLKLRYAMRRVLQPGTNPVIQIHHEGEQLDIPTIRKILELFPDFVYVELISNVSFRADNQGDNYNFGETAPPDFNEDTSKVKTEMSELERRQLEKYGGDRTELVIGHEKQ